MSPTRSGRARSDDVRTEPPKLHWFSVLPNSASNQFGDQTEFLLSGSFASPVPIQAVSLRHHDGLVGCLQYRRPSAQWYTATMHNLGVLHNAFSFNVWLSTQKIEKGVDFAIEAADCSGKTYDAHIWCIADPNSKGVAFACDSGKVLVDLPTEAPVVVRLEKAAIVNTILQVHGWAVSRSRLIDLQVAAGGSAASAVRGEPRLNIARSNPRYPNAVEAGFYAQCQLADVLSAQFELIATSQEGAEYRGIFPLVARSGDQATPIGEGFASGEAPPPGIAASYLEHPPTENGVAFLNERQRFQLVGWAAAQDGIEIINVYVDSNLVGKAPYGSPRPDVAIAFPGWKGADKSGFRMWMQPQSFLRNPSNIRLELHLCSGQKLNREVELWFGIRPASPSRGDRSLEYFMSDVSLWQFARTLAMFAAGQEEHRLKEMEQEAGFQGDRWKIERVHDIRAALNFLKEAWAGKPVDERLLRYLRDNGYFWRRSQER